MRAGGRMSSQETSSCEGLRLGVTRACDGRCHRTSPTWPSRSHTLKKRSSRRSRTTFPNFKQKVLTPLNHQNQKTTEACKIPVPSIPIIQIGGSKHIVNPRYPFLLSKGGCSLYPTANLTTSYQFAGVLPSEPR